MVEGGVRERGVRIRLLRKVWKLGVEEFGQRPRVAISKGVHENASDTETITE